MDPILRCVLPGTLLNALTSFKMSTTLVMSESSLRLRFVDCGYRLPGQNLSCLERNVCTLAIHQLLCVSHYHTMLAMLTLK